MNSVEIHHLPPEDFQFDAYVAACFIEHQDSYLFLKKTPYWTVPAGKMEKGESPREAVLREVKEETGICLRSHPVKKIGQLYIRKPGCDFAFYLFCSNLKKKTEVRLSSEHSEYDWILKENIRSLSLMPGGQEAFEYYQKNYSKEGFCKD